MNRIILIGNGFDLAHDLPTSYKNFIDDLWKNIIKEFLDTSHRDHIKHEYSNEFIHIKLAKTIFTQSFSNVQSFNDFKVALRTNVASNSEPMYIEFKNKFLQRIMDREKTLHDWVDIEEEYYLELKDILHEESNYYQDDEEERSIEKLNKDFDCIKKTLEKYLDEKCNDNVQTINNILEIIYKEFNERDFIKNGIDVKELKNSESRIIFPTHICFLNFNYTKTAIDYRKEIRIDNQWKSNCACHPGHWDEIDTEIIHIHGELNKQDNPIIFGYGDEQDDAHKEIEKRGGEYLDNIKTINYTKAPNYKQIINYIESDKYQVLIMGHSCGLSDKTLLNTLFEHENCVSIKPCMFRWEGKDKEGKYIEHDDYDKIIKNIYRCFSKNNKPLMRDKVVNKKYC
jgi:hypothetical protein